MEPGTIFWPWLLGLGAVIVALLVLGWVGEQVVDWWRSRR